MLTLKYLFIYSLGLGACRSVLREKGWRAAFGSQVLRTEFRGVRSDRNTFIHQVTLPG